MVDWLSLISLTIPRVLLVFAFFFLFFFSFFSFSAVADALSSGTVSTLRFLHGVASVFCGFEGGAVDVGVWSGGVEVSVLVRCSSTVCSTSDGGVSVGGGVALVGSVLFGGEDIVSSCWLLSASLVFPRPHQYNHLQQKIPDVVMSLTRVVALSVVW